MHDPRIVRGPERGQDPKAHPGGLSRWQRPVSHNRVPQRTVRDKLHHQPGPTVLLDNVVDGDDIRVAEPGGHLGFPHRATPCDVPFGGVHLRRPDDLFDGDIPAEQFIAGPPYQAHPAPTDDAAKPVTPGKEAL